MLNPWWGGGGGRIGPPSSFLQITRKNLKLTSPETSWLFLNISCTEFQQKKNFKNIVWPPFQSPFWKSVKKWPEKKVVGSKNVFYKSCRKFYILGGDFFSFWRNFKNEDSRAKKRFSDFAYKTRVFSPGAPKNIFFQKKTLQASYTHLLRWFRTIFNIGYGGAESAPPRPTT